MEGHTYQKSRPDPVYTAVCDGNLAKLQTLLEAGRELDLETRIEFDTPLMAAVKRNNLEAVQMLLEAGADPCYPHVDGVGEYTPLHTAAQWGHLEIIRLLWTTIPSEKLALHENKPRFEGCLVLAARYGHTSVLKYLLDGWLDSLGWSAHATEGALCSAAAAYEVHSAMLLLDRVKTYSPGALKFALFSVVRHKVRDPVCPYPDAPFGAVDPISQELLVKALIEAGPLDPDLSYWQLPMIHHAIHAIDLIGALRGLLAKGANPNAQNERGMTPLQRLSVPTFTRAENEFDQEFSLHETGIHLLLEHGASVTAADHEGETPLHAAAFGCPLHLFQRYLATLDETQDALSAVNNHGETLLHYAAAGGNIGVMRFLLEEFPQTSVDIVNRANSNGWTPLICALAPTRMGEDNMQESKKTPTEALQAAQLLLSYGADPAAITAEGWTALHWLASYRTHPGDTRFSALAVALIHKGAPLQAKARRMKRGWERLSWYPAVDPNPSHCLPWGFRMQRMFKEAPKGVFVVDATTASDWARRCKSKEVERVLLAREEETRAG
ncbi:uncharacterized protein DNG_08785 [Cephalotrichum gorgonifer]|uniref:Uncharacterized protein n=1 Tax=Cephalotrichum gorgonifer TaxID=2041049 RepID=A0AAE8N495_9PEZI|nr:uncharacterized protein DNG_08785 [Cephalotrichum gorgonifer]